MKRAWIWRLLWVTAIGLLIFVQPHDPLAIDANARFESPSWQHWLGTDRLGRDIFSRTGVAIRTTVVNAGAAELGSFCLALMIGAGIAFLAVNRPRLGTVASTATLSLRMVPPFLLAFTAAVILRRSPWGMIVSLMVLSFIYSEPVFRAEFRQCLRMPQIEGALVLGASRWRILFRYVLPEAMPRLLRYAVLDFSTLVGFEALLGFVGFTFPPRPSLGAMIYESRSYTLEYPWLFLGPAAALALLLVGGWQFQHRIPQWR